MSKTPKPIVHARDHEHGGADTVRIVYETVGTGGGTTTALPTIKAHFDGDSIYDHFTIGSIANGDDGDWTYDYALEDPSLLYIDPTTNLISRAAGGAPGFGIYLVTYTCGLYNQDGTYHEINASNADQLVEISDRRHPVDAAGTVCRITNVTVYGPPNTLQIRHDSTVAGLNPPTSATMSVTLLNPGSVT